ncbi:hypothetical protein I7I48_06116 [Histoplasma ohiense]|nr:hypothetical protein I7I48_06116 [Histoplasma ohiense (nom. inval.)]
MFMNPWIPTCRHLTFMCCKKPKFQCNHIVAGDHPWIQAAEEANNHGLTDFHTHSQQATVEDPESKRRSPVPKTIFDSFVFA